MTAVVSAAAAALSVSSPPPPSLTTPLRGCALFLACTLPLALLEPTTLFTWHPTLLALGFFGLGAQGLLRARAARPTEGSERVSALWGHAAWMCGSVACVVGGGWAIYENKVGLVGLGWEERRRGGEKTGRRREEKMEPRSHDDCVDVFFCFQRVFSGKNIIFRITTG